MAQAIFLPGAWGKILDFSGKITLPPGAAMAFSNVLNYPPFCTSEKFLKNF
nr:MAG TPA: hypothetical protein [Caudoviricetes sp.]